MLRFHRTFGISALLVSSVFMPISGVATAQDQAAPAVETQVQAPPAAPALTAPAAQPAQPAAAAAPAAVNNQSPLQQREQELLDELSLLKTDDPNYADRFQSIGAELRDIQARIQEQSLPQAFPGMPNAAMPQNPQAAMPQQPGMPQVGLPQNPNAPFGAPFPAQNGAMPNVPAGAFNPQGGMPQVQGGFDPMNDPALYKQIKEELTFQLKQLQQTLSVLGPQDEALSATLKEQQTDLLKQLADVNGKLGQPADSMAADPNAAIAPNISADPNAANGLNPAIAADPTAPMNLNAFNDKVAKAQQAAMLLQEAGLVELANHALNQAAELGNPNFTEAPLPNAGGDWFNPGGAKADDIAELKATIAELKTQLDTMSASLTEITTQLKLLSRQSVE